MDIRIARTATAIGLISLAAFTAAQAAERVDLRKQDAIKEALNARSAASLEQVMGLASDSELREVRRQKDETSRTHVRYRQHYRGIPVWGEEIVFTRGADGGVERLHGESVTGIGEDLADVVPRIEAAEALYLARNDTRTRSQANEPLTFEREEAELVIYIDDSDRARLAYRVSFFADVPGGGHPTRPTYLIDADTKEVLHRFDSIAHVEGTGPGGNERTGRYHYGTDFPAFTVSEESGDCYMENANVRAVNLNHQTDGNQTFSYDCYENTFKQINGAYSPINDAFYFGGVVYDMYQDWYGTEPLSFQLTVRVHYGRNYENAFWNGETMTFGDGASNFYPLTDLNVVSHEVSHGFTEQNSGLIYSGKSGGINEAFSDMAGEAAEYFMEGSNDWLVGADIVKGGGAMRYMADPPRDGASIGSADDYYSGMDVHNSSGVFNKAYYTLATTDGWGTRKAFEVFVRANQYYWTPSSNFQQAAQGVVDAATDLGYDTADVEAAFAAVDVPVDGNGGGGSDDVLDNGETVTISANGGEWVRYQLEIPAGASDLSIQTTGGTGDGDLYTRYGAEPTRSEWDCRPYNWGNEERCTASTPTSGTHYIGVYAYQAFSNVELSVSWR